MLGVKRQRFVLFRQVCLGAMNKNRQGLMEYEMKGTLAAVLLFSLLLNAALINGSIQSSKRQEQIQNQIFSDVSDECGVEVLDSLLGGTK